MQLSHGLSVRVTTVEDLRTSAHRVRAELEEEFQVGYDPCLIPAEATGKCRDAEVSTEQAHLLLPDPNLITNSSLVSHQPNASVFSHPCTTNI